MSRNAYFKGLKDEQLFMELTGATPRVAGQTDNNHIDCNLDGFTVDVKGLKRSHKAGYVLVEFKNSAGKAGWANPNSGCDKVAFRFPEGFYVVDAHRLYNYAKKLVKHDGGYGKVIRKSGVKPKDGLYKLIGRNKYRGIERKDVFTYIRKKDLLRIGAKLYKIKENNV